MYKVLYLSVDGMPFGGTATTATAAAAALAICDLCADGSPIANTHAHVWTERRRRYLRPEKARVCAVWHRSQLFTAHTHSHELEHHPHGQ